jgi:hypothetical protein
MNKQELLRARNMAPVNITSLYSRWDTCDMILNQVKYLLEEDEDTKTRLEEVISDKINKLDTPPDKSSKEKIKREQRDYLKRNLFDEVSQDSDFFRQEYEFFCDDLTELLKSLCPDGYFKVEVHNFGWQSQDGYKYMEARTGRDLLNGILPDTDCTFSIFKVKHGKQIAIQNSHHDSPYGNEWYVIKPCASSTYYKFKG